MSSILEKVQHYTASDIRDYKFSHADEAWVRESDIRAAEAELQKRVAELERDIDRMLEANGDLVKELEQSKRQVHDLLNKKFAHFANEECWIYQGENDQLESLTCPVVISAAKLLELERERDYALKQYAQMDLENSKLAGEITQLKGQVVKYQLKQAASGAVPEVTDDMIDRYLQANDGYWAETDAMPSENPSKFRNGTVREATRASLIAVLSATPQPVCPVRWINGCNTSAPEALRYLANNPRPDGGNDRFNAEHLYQIARELEYMASMRLFQTPQPAVSLASSDPEGHRQAIADHEADMQPAVDEPEEPEETLEEACSNLLNYAIEFFNAGRQNGIYGGVRWLLGENGELVIFTRGEYRETLLKNIVHTGDPEIMFNGLTEAETSATASVADIHSCSYFCDRPECIKTQRDELRQMFDEANKPAPLKVPNNFMLDSLFYQSFRFGLFRFEIFKELLLAEMQKGGA